MSTTRKMRLTFIAKLRHVGNYRPNEQMIIRNFSAIAVMAQGELNRAAKEWDLYKACRDEAVQILNDELKDYMAGQQLVIPMKTGAEFGFGDLGGVM